MLAAAGAVRGEVMLRLLYLRFLRWCKTPGGYTQVLFVACADVHGWSLSFHREEGRTIVDGLAGYCFHHRYRVSRSTARTRNTVGYSCVITRWKALAWIVYAWFYISCAVRTPESF